MGPLQRFIWRRGWRWLLRSAGWKVYNVMLTRDAIARALALADAKLDERRETR